MNLESGVILKGKDLFEVDCPIYVNFFQERKNIQKHSHDFYEITYVAEGEGVHYISGETIPTMKGDLFLIPIGVSHKFHPKDDETPLKVINCVFDRQLINSLLEQPHFGLAEDYSQIMRYYQGLYTWQTYRERSGEFYNIFFSMYFLYINRTPGYRYKLYLSLLGLLDSLYRASNHSSMSRQTAATSFEQFSSHPLFPALCYMNNHYMKHISINDICAVINMSPRHFQRCFKSLTGLSFSQMLQHIRLEQSCQLLLHSDMSVQSISSHVGIADLKHFYQLFNHKYGVTPACYRKLFRHAAPVL
jgi:AraC-like DNA-binding protein